MMTLVQGLRAAIVSLRDVTGLTSEPFEDGPFCGSMNENANVSFDWFDAGEHTEVASPEGMIMYMDGFRFSLAGGAPCLNLYFPSWTLDTREKFWIAMLGIFLLSIATEGLSKTRSLLSKRLKGGIKRWTITLLHGLQALVGYILMLATMTFSVELLFCVILGLGTGFAIFYDDEDSHVTTNPCCNFIQEEFNERASALRQQHLEEEEKAREEQLPGGEQRAAELNEEDESELALTTNTV